MRDLELDHSSACTSGFFQEISVCSGCSHLCKFKSEPIQACMFSGRFYEAEVMYNSGNVTNCGTWEPRAQRWQAGSTIHLCDFGQVLKPCWTSVSLSMKIGDWSR